MRSIVMLSLIVGLAGCQPEELPGESIGVYAISGALEDNTCGHAALPAANPLVFDAEIRIEGEGGNWIVGDPPGFEGVVNDDGGFLFGVESFSTVIAPGSRTNDLEQPEDYIDGTVSGARPEVGCTLSIVEQIDGTIHRRLMSDGGIHAFGIDVDPEADDQTDDLMGENRISMAAMPGSDCSRVLATNGGPFLALPCYALYTINGELHDAAE